jgi:hypothetical protein
MVLIAQLDEANLLFVLLQLCEQQIRLSLEADSQSAAFGKPSPVAQTKRFANHFQRLLRYCSSFGPYQARRKLAIPAAAARDVFLNVSTAANMANIPTAQWMPTTRYTTRLSVLANRS